jgi:NAD(P)-dependent dehydrogenase (short-subunit alcohol dehydrogenase family)
VKNRESVVLVTGTYRGMGLEHTRHLLAAGARKAPLCATAAASLAPTRSFANFSDLSFTSRTSGDLS